MPGTPRRAGALATVIVLVGAAAVAAGCPPLPPTGSPGADGAPAPADPPPAGAPADDPAIARFVERLDDERARRGCPRLVWHDAVAAVAAAHRRDMAQRGYFSHTSPDGRDPFRRLSDAGVRYTAAAENIAHGRPTGDGVFTQWLGSPPHRDNMLNCRFTHHGVGLDRTYWTHVLIRR